MSKANSGKITTSLKKAKAMLPSERLGVPPTCPDVDLKIAATDGDAQYTAKAIRDAMSPQAVALMIAHLQGATCKDKQAVKGVEWFVEVLTNTVGGPDAVSSLFDEIGV
jgi:hypothetical protein